MVVPFQGPRTGELPSSPARDAVFAVGVAAVLRDDLVGASVEEAGRAVLGYTILNGWSAGEGEAPHGWAARRVPAQLGPVLVTPGEVGDLARLKAQVRIDGKVTASASLGGWTFSLAESIAWLSRWMDLRAGDVIGAGRVRDGRGAVPFGATVEIGVERLGRLLGRPVQGELCAPRPT